jgi:aspartate kinase
MSVVVQKFGGSSVADVARIAAVADKVVATKKAGHDVVVVVSAMKGRTDALLELAQQICADPPRRELDMLLTTGERVTMALLSMAIQERGVEAISFTGSQSGILTNDRHFDARIVEVRPYRIEDELARGRVVIVAGFQGMSYKREITTLGRGGSDTTAVALAAALGAERAEIYSDVDGVYSADPRRVPDAAHLPEVTFDEMAEMAHAGAKVLHAAAVDYARRHGITLVARSTFTPGRETRVAASGGGAARPAVVGKDGLAELQVEASALPRVLAACEGVGVEAWGSGLDGDRAFALIPREAPGVPRLLAELRETVTLVEGLALVTVIHQQVALHRVLDAFAAAAVVPRRVHASPLRVRVTVDAGRLERAVSGVHAALGTT